MRKFIIASVLAASSVVSLGAASPALADVRVQLVDHHGWHHHHRWDRRWHHRRHCFVRVVRGWHHGHRVVRRVRVCR